MMPAKSLTYPFEPATCARRLDREEERRKQDSGEEEATSSDSW
jgi:hypothetical protein